MITATKANEVRGALDATKDWRMDVYVTWDLIRQRGVLMEEERWVQVRNLLIDYLHLLEGEVEL